MAELKEGRYVNTDWQPEHSDVIKCPDCKGPVKYKDWEDINGNFVATYYRCEDCRINWWDDGKF